MQADDIYSSDYLAATRQGDDSGFIFDARDCLNRLQRHASTEVFGHVVVGDTAPQRDLGVVLTRASLSGDTLSLKESDADVWPRVGSCLRVAVSG